METKSDRAPRTWLPIWWWLGGVALLIVVLLAISFAAVVYRARSQAYLISVVRDNSGWTSYTVGLPDEPGDSPSERIRAAVAER